jgi:hypothetical protein
VQKLGIEANFIKQSVKENKHNHGSTSYYLQMSKMIRENGGRPLHEKNSMSHEVINRRKISLGI